MCAGLSARLVHTMSIDSSELVSVSQSTGFLPSEEPLCELPVYYAPWERILEKIADLISQRRLRRDVDSLPSLVVSQRLLPTERHWRRACVVLTYLSQVRTLVKRLFTVTNAYVQDDRNWNIYNGTNSVRLFAIVLL